jgi:competence protein ComEC
VPHGALDVAASTMGRLSLAIILAWAVLPRAWPGRYAAVLGLVALLSARVAGPPEDCADVRMLDVGQGLAVVVRTRQRTLLYDTGAAFRGGSDMASRVVLPYLSSQGVRRIDRLVLSHSDIDHAGGAARILADVEVGEVLAGEPDTVPIAAACRRGQAWRWDGVGFRVLHPGAGERRAGNDASCVVLVSAGDAGLLLSGDIEAGVERLLVAARVPGNVDAVVVPHHGSATSSSEAFVRVLAADLALVSAGYRNRWQLPRPEVVERWRSAGAAVLDTARDGAIAFRLCGKSGITKLERNRKRSRRVWYEPPAR